ncbi:MAG: DUF3857 domain-containing protein [Novosphingobium sp.]|nr:DUF3857 domain-containing protein [Novosphingobium sp.]
MKSSWLAAIVLLPLTAVTARAGDTPLYQPAPAWVEPVDAIAVAAKSTGPVVLFDLQQRIEGDRVTTYVDSAFRLDTPQALTQLGTLTAAWLPDKGDLVIHRAELLRDGAAIDLLDNGPRFSVLRREQQLEQRSLDGMLTATMPVAGARLSDVIRLAISISSADAALGGNVQRIDALPARPFEAGMARFKVSWPASRRLTFAGKPELTLPEASERDGIKQLVVALPLAKPKDLPKDAPARFGLPPQLQMTSFADWQDVSRTFAKLFASEDRLAGDSALGAEVARIAAAGADPVERMAQALRLVQDRISYLANGMNGGNYVPQSPAETWSARYGDCKAKTLLLLAMLRELGIESEAVLVNTRFGDAVGEAPTEPRSARARRRSAMSRRSASGCR